MKYLYTIFSFSIMMLMSSCGTSRYYQSDSGEYYQQQPEITYQQFYNDLSPYGNWINYQNYGYAWIPNQYNFRPYYSNGHWAYTNYGWTWVSNYNWGWAPFHYGSWINDFRYGWVWIPGYEWAPAWVAWRGGGNYYGWAPLGPDMSANIYSGSIPYYDWTFVPGRYMTSSRMNNYYVNPANNVTIINSTTIINNTTIVNNGRNNNNMGPRRYYNAGPSVTEVERSTGAPIRKFNVVEANKPSAARVNNNSIRVFRPAVNQQASTRNASPQRVQDLNQIRQMHNENQPGQRQNNQQNNPQNTPPVREFPKNQTPQILRDEPPVRDNNPGVSPGNRKNAPARIFEKRNNNGQQQEMNRTSQQPTSSQENPNRNNTPVRTFTPHNNQQQNENRPVEQQPKAPVQQNLNRNNDVPQRNVQNNNSQPPQQQNIYKRNENEINTAPSTQSAPVRTFDPETKKQ